MATVSDASRTGSERGRSAPSPLGRAGSVGGLSRLIRSAGGEDERSVLFASSNSMSELSRPVWCGPVASGVNKSYVFGCIAKRSFGSEAS